MSDSDDKTTYTEKGEPIKWFNRTVDSFLDKTTLVFGGSGSGKTTAVEEILYLCKNHIPNYLVVAPKTSDTAYRSKLPAKCIKEDLTKKKLKTIWERQYFLTQLYNTANDVNVLESLFKKTSDRRSSAVIFSAAFSARRTIDNIEKSSFNFAQKKSQINIVKDLCTKKLKKIYKTSIRNNKAKLEAMAEANELDDKEKVALEYLDVNPRLMLIIDDSTEKFQMWMKYFKKGEENIFECIFYKGRWNYITLVFAAHDDKVVPPELRKNARVSYYMTSQALMASINKAQSGFTSQEKKFAQRAADVLFTDDINNIKTHQKLCYIREDPCPFRYMIANLYPDFRLGCAALYELANKMPKNDDGLSSNPYARDIVEQKEKRKPNRRRPIKTSKRKFG